MKILDYNDVDPLQVLHLNLLALNFPLTPEYAAHIRRTDPRPFPCLTINAVGNSRLWGETVMGQVGVFRLPMVSVAGREDVGGVWAVSTHPEHAGKGVASALLEAAHERMRRAGLRFSTLGTSRSGGAYRLYRRLGYTDMNVWASAVARWETAHQPSRLSAKRLDGSEFEFVEALFGEIGRDYLGFTRRHTPFTRLRDKVSPDDIWIIRENDTPAGYLFAHQDGAILRITLQILRDHIAAAEAVAAVTAQLRSAYVQIALSRPANIAGLRRAGWQIAHPSWEAFMVKPLSPDVTAEDARRLFGIGTDRFLISWLDTT